MIILVLLAAFAPMLSAQIEDPFAKKWRDADGYFKAERRANFRSAMDHMIGRYAFAVTGEKIRLDASIARITKDARTNQRQLEIDFQGKRYRGALGPIKLDERQPSVGYRSLAEFNALLRSEDGDDAITLNCMLFGSGRIEGSLAYFKDTEAATIVARTQSGVQTDSSGLIDPDPNAKGEFALNRL